MSSRFSVDFGSIACRGSNQEKFLRVRRGCQASQRKGWPPGKSGELPGKSGELPGKSGKLPGKSGDLLFSSTVRELPGKAPENFRGSRGNFRGSPGTFQKPGGAWLPPSDLPNFSPIKIDSKTTRKRLEIDSTTTGSSVVVGDESGGGL